MLNDAKKELELLEKQLLDDEEWFRQELDSAKRMIGLAPERPASQPAANPRVAPATPVRNYANGYGQAERKPRVQKLVQEEAPMPKPKGIKGLLILAILETLGILGLAAYWMLVLLK